MFQKLLVPRNQFCRKSVRLMIEAFSRNSAWVFVARELSLVILPLSSEERGPGGEVIYSSND